LFDGISVVDTSKGIGATEAKEYGYLLHPVTPAKYCLFTE